jgi:hypothetical protein
MGKKDWETAKNYLEKVHLAGDSTNRDDAVWYLAIVALQQNNPQRASCFLHELVETPNSWQQKASAMLEELNK